MSSIHFHPFPSKYWTINPSNAIIRGRFVKTKMYPTASEIKDSLGSVMADVFFSTLTPDVKDCIGLGKSLKGPQGSLWTSPLHEQDVDNRNRKMTEVPSLHLVQSFTHAGIAKMGEKYEAKQEKMVKETIEKALVDQERSLSKLMEEKLREMREKTKCEFFQLYSLRMKEVFLQLKKQFEERLAEREKIIRQELEAEKEHALNTLKRSMECEVQNIVRELNINFDQRLKFMNMWDANQHYEEFCVQTRFFMKKWSALFHCAKKNASKSSRMALKNAHIHHNMFTMKVIQRERDNFYNVLYELLQYFQGRLKELTNEVDTLRHYIESLDLENVALLERKAWECVLKDVIGQFQKFINYVLKEVPGQANYLLSLSEICKNRKECLKKIRHKQEHFGSPQINLQKNWGEVFQEAQEVKQQQYTRLAQSSHCKDVGWGGPKPEKQESPEDIEENLHRILQDQEKRMETLNWTKYLVNWITCRLNNNEGGLPEIPKPPSEAGSQDSELVRYLDEHIRQEEVEKRKPVPMAGFMTSAGDAINAKEERNLHLMGSELEQEWETVGMSDRRVNSLIDILVAHPELKNVIIKP
ncbi:uncharacterized protein LOC106662652 [Cimex lectularius]|uniref:Uncharacterized protein n=1 Tax=Cimex lectularius TaxID=79782 RepID=A0A8I6REL7_CIMLE|nr:uncharacterized protein LOC106662652 [Cimex lectularius]